MSLQKIDDHIDKIGYLRERWAIKMHKAALVGLGEVRKLMLYRVVIISYKP